MLCCTCTPGRLNYCTWSALSYSHMHIVIAQNPQPGIFKTFLGRLRPKCFESYKIGLTNVQHYIASFVIRITRAQGGELLVRKSGSRIGFFALCGM